MVNQNFMKQIYMKISKFYIDSLPTLSMNNGWLILHHGLSWIERLLKIKKIILKTFE